MLAFIRFIYPVYGQVVARILRTARQASGKFFVCVFAALAPLLTVQADIHFEDVTSDVGINYVGPSWGAAWGDFNGDGLPDLWASNHGRPESLYINMIDQFVDIGPDVIPATASDTHGAAWSDFDNDGDQDLIQLADANNGPNSLMVNLGDGTIQDEALSRGVQYAMARGRTPLWFDYDADGWLDLVVTSSSRAGDADTYNSLFHQQDGLFTIVDDEVGLLPTAALKFMMITDWTLDFSMELIAASEFFPDVVYDTSQVPFTQPSFLSPTPLQGIVDVAVADFDGDLLNDVFSVHGLPGNQVLQVDDFLVESHVKANANVEVGVDLETSGNITVDFSPDWLLRRGTLVYVGASATQLSDFGFEFVLSADDPDYHGLPPHVSGSDTGIYLGYDPVSEIWHIQLSNLGFEINFEIVSVEPIVSVETIGFDGSAPPNRADTLLIRTANGFEDRSSAAGVDITSWGRSVVAGDFDNDMDLDVYILATGQTRNRVNILYENIGNAVFVPVADNGAPGPVQGKGDAIAMADYNVDGYLDLFLTNGKSRAEWDQDGPSTLYRNSGGNNNWLHRDLQGVSSNRDGIGSIVYAVAGGVTQIREQNSGMHYRAQNHQRLHFGLASNTVADVVVHWPSGIVQEVSNVEANQVVTIVEIVPSDSDGDGVNDSLDNCTDMSNADQLDTNSDGIGNACDADIDNNCVVNFLDSLAYRDNFFSAGALDTDNNGDNLTNFADLAVLSAQFLGAPGPSASGCN